MAQETIDIWWAIAKTFGMLSPRSKAIVWGKSGSCNAEKHGLRDLLISPRLDVSDPAHEFMFIFYKGNNESW
jgi:hypothetical protein